VRKEIEWAAAAAPARIEWIAAPAAVETIDEDRAMPGEEA